MVHSSPSRPRLRASGILLAAALALTACGGGGGGSAPVTPAPPPVAVQAPAIATQPAAQSVTAGQSVTFTVAASGEGLSYQWQRDGKDIAGATGASYTIGAVQGSDNGASFTVVVKNAGGSVTSAAAILRVVMVATSGRLALLAGPLGGSGNLDGPVGRFNVPGSIAASPSGALYVTDAVPWMASRVITQTPGQPASVTTLPRQQAAIIGAVDAAGNRYELDTQQIYKRTPAGVRSFVAGTVNYADPVFQAISGIAVDASGTLYVADAQDHVIRKVTPQGAVMPFAGSLGQAGTQDGMGEAARFTGPGKLVLDKAGNLLAGDGTVVRKITPGGVVTTLAGVRPDSPAALSTNPAWFPTIDGLGVDAAGNVYVLSGNLRRVAPNGEVSHFTPPAQQFASVPPFGSFPSMTQDGAGNFYLTSESLPVVWRVSLAGDIAVVAGKAPETGVTDGKGEVARFSSSTAAWPASSLVPDAQGNVYVADGARVRKITPDGTVSTLPLAPGDPIDRAIIYYPSGYASGADLLAFSNGVLSRIDANGNKRFVAGQAWDVTARQALLDGVGAAARFVNPKGFVLDAQGNAYCLDQQPPRFFDDPFQVFVIRKIGADGTVSTLPIANPPYPRSWFVDRDGKLVMAATSGAVLRLEPDNSFTTLRAAPAAAATTSQTVVAGDLNGNLYVADSVQTAEAQGAVLHRITPGGVDTVIAGRPDTLGVQLGSLPASLGIVTSLAIGTDGAVYIMSENSVLKLTQ